MDVNGVKLPASTPFRRRKHWCCSLQQKISTGRDCQCYEMSVNRYHEPCRSRGVSCDQGHHLAAEQIFSAEDVNQRMYMTIFSRCKNYRSWRRWLAAAETKPTHITGGEPPARGINQQRYFLYQQQLIPTPEKNIFPTLFFTGIWPFFFGSCPFQKSMMSGVSGQFTQLCPDDSGDWWLTIYGVFGVPSPEILFLNIPLELLV
jgi:hypothetical protein